MCDRGILEKIINNKIHENNEPKKSCSHGFYILQRCFYKKRDETIDHWDQSWDNKVFAAHSDRCMKFNIFHRMIFAII